MTSQQAWRDAKRAASATALGALMMSLSAPVQAQEFFEGTRPIGMGGTANALSEGTSGLYQNPAGIASAMLYTIEGAYTYTDQGNILSAAVVDSKTNPSVSAGFGLGYYFTHGDEAITALDLRVPLAFPIVPQRASLGVAARYLSVTNDGIETLSGFTFDAGILFRITDQVQLGVAAKNLIDQCEIEAQCRGLAPRMVGGGVAFTGVQDLANVGDLDFDLNSRDSPTLGFSLGAEYLVQQMLPIRLGFARSGVREENVLTAGTGWRSTSAGVDLSYQHVLSAADDERVGFGLLSLGISVYLQ